MLKKNGKILNSNLTTKILHQLLLVAVVQRVQLARSYPIDYQQDQLFVEPLEPSSLPKDYHQEEMAKNRSLLKQKQLIKYDAHWWIWNNRCRNRGRW
jgi:hypothetical protein